MREFVFDYFNASLTYRKKIVEFKWFCRNFYENIWYFFRKRCAHFEFNLNIFWNFYRDNYLNLSISKRKINVVFCDERFLFRMKTRKMNSKIRNRFWAFYARDYVAKTAQSLQFEKISVISCFVLEEFRIDV